MCKNQKFESRINTFHKIFWYLNLIIFCISAIFWIGAYFIGDDFRIVAMGLLLLVEYVFVITIFVVMYFIYFFRKNLFLLKEYWRKLVFIGLSFIAFIVSELVIYILTNKIVLFDFELASLGVFPILYLTYLFFILYENMQIRITK